MSRAAGSSISVPWGVRIAASALCVVAASCADLADLEPEPPRWSTGVDEVLEKCAECHAPDGDDPDLSSFLAVAACAESGAPWAAKDGALVQALERPDHATILTADEAGLLRRWVSRGLVFGSTLPHPAGFAGPMGGPEFHGALLRVSGYSRMLDTEAEDACMRCHDAAKRRGTAPACADCHGDAIRDSKCGTCHGSGADPMPRDIPCKNETARRAAGAHATHSSSAEGSPFPKTECSDCHRVPDTLLAAGHIEDGRAEVVFRASSSASYDPARMSCSDVDCHFGRTQTWTSTRSDTPCGVCHGYPPATHESELSCATCHSPAFDGERPRADRHLDGRVEVGEQCGDCHTDTPAPRLPGRSAGAHALHLLGSPIRDALTCRECHSAPAAVTASGHLDSRLPAEVVLTSALATAGGALTPSFDGQRCAEVGCHGDHLESESRFDPVWSESAEPAPCGSCHGLPPVRVRGGAANHLPTGPAECGACHQTPNNELITVGTSSITSAGRHVHVNGCVDLAADLGPRCAP